MTKAPLARQKASKVAKAATPQPSASVAEHPVKKVPQSKKPAAKPQAQVDAVVIDQAQTDSRAKKASPTQKDKPAKQAKASTPVTKQTPAQAPSKTPAKARLKKPAQ
ncbi:MAG: hypothetical protein AAB176_01060, partial [Pseudomonadota bacterium]